MNSSIPFNRHSSHKQNRANKKGLGLRLKMVFLFVVIPIILVALSGLIHLKQMNTLSSMIIRESSNMLDKISRDIIADKAGSVATQCGNYLRKNPQLKRKDFSKDSLFVDMAMQKVGETGYTSLYTIPDKNGKSSLWVHPNPKIIGIDLPKAVRKILGGRYDDWFNIYKGAYKGRESMGYYLWKDKDGRYREKFMVCTPIKGTPYVIASTAYIHEFKQDLKQMRRCAERISDTRRNTDFIVLVGTLIILGIIVTLFSNSLSKRIISLADLAERISLGELGIQTKDKSKDEIGRLAFAIERMRVTICISLDRLKNR
jgi:HAMP domain-containing protein